MWIDRSDFNDQLASRVRDGRLTSELGGAIKDFERDGYIILRNAAPVAALDAFEESITRAFREGHADLIAQDPGGASRPVTAGMERRKSRIVDSFVPLPAALDLLSSPRLVEFMRAVFDDTPMLFQSISFDMGSEQGLHQDTAYVVINRPMEMLACWIALEDVQPGSGELQYMVGSHRLADYMFGGKRKHWNPVDDGHDVHNEWTGWIYSESAKRGLSTEKFMAKRGDILIWHADLAHGGSPIANPELTRKSLVGHYCPVSATPYYFEVTPKRAVRCENGEMAYASWHYDLKADQPVQAASPPRRSWWRRG